jgi:hypothetical protein
MWTILKQNKHLTLVERAGKSFRIELWVFDFLFKNSLCICVLKNLDSMWYHNLKWHLIDIIHKNKYTAGYIKRQYLYLYFTNELLLPFSQRFPDVKCLHAHWSSLKQTPPFWHTGSQIAKIHHITFYKLFHYIKSIAFINSK